MSQVPPVGGADSSAPGEDAEFELDLHSDERSDDFGDRGELGVSELARGGKRERRRDELESAHRKRSERSQRHRERGADPERTRLRTVSRVPEPSRTGAGQCRQQTASSSGVVGYPGKATVQLSESTAGTFATGTSLPVPDVQIVQGVSFFIGSLPKSACDYPSIELNATAAGVSAQHNLGFGACAANQIVPITESQGEWDLPASQVPR